MAFFLQRIIGRGRAEHLYFIRVYLKGLFIVRRQNEFARYEQAGADVLLCDLVVIRQFAAVENDLAAFEERAVVEFYKTESLAVADGARPASDGDLLIRERFGTGKISFNLVFFICSTCFSIYI